MEFSRRVVHGRRIVSCRGSSQRGGLGAAAAAASGGVDGGGGEGMAEGVPGLHAWARRNGVEKKHADWEREKKREGGVDVHVAKNMPR